MPHCRVEVFVDKTEDDPIVLIGDIAHLSSHADSGPRANVSLSSEHRNDYENLVILCKNCHATLDGQKNQNSIARIRQLKTDHEAWVRASLPARGRSRNGWSTVILEDRWPIDPKTFDAALSPDYIDGSVLRINAELTTGGWPETAPRIRDEINAMLRSGDPFEKRIAVFPLARVSACLYAGYILTNRPNVQLFQYHRDDGTWVWPATAEIGETAEVFTEGTTEPNNIFFAFDLTARVNLEPLLRGLSAVRIIRIGIKSPTSGWLQHPEQLRRLGITTREAFEAALSISSPSTMWHLLFAGPAPGAVKVGQQLNPTMTPKTQLYEYLHPRHNESLSIESNPA